MSIGIKHLVLVPDAEHHSVADFQQIASLIRERAADIRPHVVAWDVWRKSPLKKLMLSRRPTLVIGMRAYGDRLRPWRGSCHQGQNLPKSATYERMEACGLAVLPWSHWTAQTPLDLDRLGPLVISKPDIGARGKSVKLRVTARLKFDPARHAQEPLVLQKFIHTGAFPSVHRVLTLYGTPLLHWRSVYEQHQPCHDASDPRQMAGHNPVASHRNATTTLNDEVDIEEFAARVARQAFPGIPLLGFDIIRSSADRTLHICEVNPYGQTWHFSSRIGLGIQSKNSLGLR